MEKLKEARKDERKANAEPKTKLDNLAGQKKDKEIQSLTEKGKKMEEECLQARPAGSIAPGPVERAAQKYPSQDPSPTAGVDSGETEKWPKNTRWREK